eukprot:m.48791 g.48791  ORF g.48791 m.48791 type:complete len:75 (-) comp17839_c0_seq2:238-462(-)
MGDEQPKKQYKWKVTKRGSYGADPTKPDELPVGMKTEMKQTGSTSIKDSLGVGKNPDAGKSLYNAAVPIDTKKE